jgi:hypothetical protein
MRSRFDEGSEASYAYYGGMLNAGYITGFTRKGAERTFYVQQINDKKVALPVEVQEKNIPLPKDTMPVKVVGRFIGTRLESGERTLHFRALTLDRPSIRELPNRLAWEKPNVNGEEGDKFEPFFDPQDNDEVSSPFYKGEKRNGRPCLNVARVAGFVESYAFVAGKEHQKNDCLYIALRQTSNPDESLPIRVYGRFTESLKQKLQIALPIFIEGFYRVKMENKGTVEAPNWTAISYIHCSNIKVATQEDIKVRPAWWNEMKDRLLRISKERIAASSAPRIRNAEETSDDIKKQRSAAKEKKSPNAGPKPIGDIPVDNDL